MPPTNKRTERTGYLTQRTVLLYTFLTSLFLINCWFTTISHAADFSGRLKGVTITDSGGNNAAPTAVINFTQNGETVNFDASGSSDDGSIKEYHWNFGDGTTGVGVNANHSYTESGEYPATLTVIDKEGAVALAQVIVGKPLFHLIVNFQPENSVAPVTNLTLKMDNGKVYDQQRGYGWNVAQTRLYDREGAISPDQFYDTVGEIRPEAIWEMDIPNNVYKIRVVVGDAQWPNSIQNVQVENSIIINNEVLNNTTRWIDRTETVDIIDGKLSLTFNGSSPIARICFIEISSIGAK
jgi:PKD domain